ncbi:MAG: lipase family protein [Oligoflexus sp.]
MKRLRRFLVVFFSFMFTHSASSYEWSKQGLMPTCNASVPITDMHLAAHQGFHLDHASIMLWASWLAERPRRNLIVQDLEARGFKKIALFGPAYFGANAYLAETEDLRLLVFRGSQDIKEWTRNALFQQSEAMELGLPGKIHSGMLQHFKELAPKILAELADTTKPLMIAGHSLGGAMALLHGLILEEQGHEIAAIYLSGAPRVGDAEFYTYAEQIFSHRLYAIEMKHDLTPMIPPSKDAATMFSQVIPEKHWFLRSKLEEVVDRLSYASANWQTVKIDHHNLLPKRYGLQGETDYWLRLQSQLTTVSSVTELWNALSSRFAEHAPEVYFCELMKRR